MTTDAASPSFGFTATDCIYRATGKAGCTPPWEGGVERFGPLAMHPAAAVLSYGLGVFEGLKARRTADGRVVLFRPEANAARFRRSAAALLMLPFPDEMFVSGIEQLVRANLRHLPRTDEGALYIRPIELAVEPRLGCAPGREFCVVMYGAPVGPYFDKEDRDRGLKLRVVRQCRVAPGGTGAAKAIGNYGGCLRVVERWREEGYHGVLFLDQGLRQITETSGANVFAVLRDGSLVTPPCDDQILAGVTRDSVIRLARELAGLEVVERPLPLDEVLDQAVELFCTGTAWTVQSVQELDDDRRAVRFPQRDVAGQLRELLEQIQGGSADDPFGWIREVTLP